VGAYRLRPSVNRIRIAATIAGLGPVVAAFASVYVGSLDPGYDPIQTSVSRLAEKGAPDEGVMNFAIACLGISFLALAFAMASDHCGVAPFAAGLVSAAALALWAATAAQIDPGNPATVIAHRGASGVAFAALAAAQLAAGLVSEKDRAYRGYRLASLVTGAVSALLLVAGVGLLFDGFPGGLWERAVALLAFTWT